MSTLYGLKFGQTVEITVGTAKDGSLRTLRGMFVGLHTRSLTDTHGALEARVATAEGELTDHRVTPVETKEEDMNDKPKFPEASDYSGEDLKAFRRGVAAAKRYYQRSNAGLSTDYSAIVERADKRDERGAWYDGFDSVCNPEYFAAPVTVTEVSEAVITAEDIPCEQVEPEAVTELPEVAREVLEVKPEPRELYCRAQPMHARNRIPAVTDMEVPGIGKVPVCQQCADYYGGTQK